MVQINLLFANLYVLLHYNLFKSIVIALPEILHVMVPDNKIDFPIQSVQYICPFLCYGGAYKDTWQLFGHVHTSKNNTGKDASRLNMLFPTQYDVGVDNNNFTPVSFDQVKTIIQKQVEQFNKNNRNGN